MSQQKWKLLPIIKASVWWLGRKKITAAKSMLGREQKTWKHLCFHQAPLHFWHKENKFHSKVWSWDGVQSAGFPFNSYLSNRQNISALFSLNLIKVLPHGCDNGKSWKKVTSISDYLKCMRPWDEISFFFCWVNQNHWIDTLKYIFSWSPRLSAKIKHSIFFVNKI